MTSTLTHQQLDTLRSIVDALGDTLHEACDLLDQPTPCICIESDVSPAELAYNLGLRLGVADPTLARLLVRFVEDRCLIPGAILYWPNVQAPQPVDA